MKKLFLGSILLTIFSLAVILFQISCQKTALANDNEQTPPSVALLSKPVITVNIIQEGVDSLGKSKYNQTEFTTLELYIVNENGLNKLNVSLPDQEFVGLNARLSGNGKTIMFGSIHKTRGYTGVYSCNIDGTNLRKVADGNYTLEDLN
ncbi:MAG: hypothetical protein KIT80_02285 [Chitinophagaceae bacterium]|nr:hypothetical protein [Chitinophagaceae bacterium]MCW5925713.1 hypothetical protein [Chitinophagaceae bacterium]